MDKNELVRATEDEFKYQISLFLTKQIITSVFKNITNALAKGEEVAIHEFGKFRVKKRPARNALNPKTGERIQVPARRAPHFVAGKNLREAVNQKGDG